LSGFVGIDPLGLAALADATDWCCTRVGLARRSIGHPTPSCLPGVESALALTAAGLRWRATVIDEGQRAPLAATAPLSSPLWVVEFAATEVFDLNTWNESFTAWRDREFLIRLRDTHPDAVAAAFAAIEHSDGLALARSHPELIGDLDGAPPRLRYSANEILIALEIVRLGQARALLEGAGRRTSSSQSLLVQIEQRIAEYKLWLNEGRQILLFDPKGDGRVVEVFGDLEGAGRIAVVVPGMANDIYNFSRFREDARSLFDAAADDAATIAWLGYDTPDGVDAVSRTAAQIGAPDLAVFIAGIDPGSQRSITVIAHSYGSVVAGIASADGIEADNLVFVGSPGTTLDSAAEAVLRPGGQVWSALARGDPIGAGVNPLAFHRWWHGLAPMVAPLAATCSLLSRDELWHGVNPAGDGFGALRFSTEGSFGHGEYFEATTLENLVLILEGRYSELELV